MTDAVAVPSETVSIPPSAHEQPKTPKAAPTKATKPKPRRKVARRRRGSDSEDEGDDGSASDASGSIASPAPVFPATSSTTPAAWADMVDTPEKGSSPVPLEEMDRGQASRGRGGAVRGRGRGGKVVRERREFTEEEQKRYEEMKKAKKERQKAKRKELKETKRKEREGATPSDPTTVGDSTADASLAASTSALQLDDSTPNPSPAAPVDQAALAVERSGINGSARGGAVGNRTRGPLPQRAAEDAKFTPRVGKFWMHDQRQYDNGKVGEGSFTGVRGMPDHWRGRGGSIRGMPPRGGFRGGPRGRGRGFAHLPFSPQAQAAAAARAAATASNGLRSTETDTPDTDASKPAQPAPRSNGIEGRWGHEGFEEFNARDEAARANRGLRGRGRGSGPMRGGMRGAIPNKVAHLPTPEASPDRVSGKISEGTSTQPAAEILLNDSGAVTVRLPGETETVAVDARPPSQAAQVPPIPIQSPFPPAFTPSNSSPGPYVASDSGSMSSGGFIAPGMPMHPNVTGEYYPMGSNAPPGARPGFYPGGNYGPQSFTPDSTLQPHQQQRGSFSGPNAPPFYPSAGSSFANQARPGAGSPLNPYAGQMGGFFVPRSHSVPFRPASGKEAAAGGDPKSPTASDAADSAGRGSFDAGQAGQQEGFVPGYYQYNPYATGAVDGQGMYYPQQGYWPQQGYEQAAYGYDGEYQGY